MVNSGDGSHAHPTQALLDGFTIYQVKKMKSLNDFKKLKVAICGDIIHSRVARSNIRLLTLLGSQINLVGPNTLLPKYMKQKNLSIYNDLEQGVKGVDVIITLRIQNERMDKSYIPSFKEYYKLYGITHQTIKPAKKDVIVLHPGPMNRYVEISSELADDKNICQVLRQVTNGIAVRQAILSILQ